MFLRARVLFFAEGLLDPLLSFKVLFFI